jgi:glycosyltransferase involved in cell wall biosynthesis
VSRLAHSWSEAGSAVGVVTIGARDTDAYALPPAVRRISLDLVRPARTPLDGAVRSLRRVVLLRRALVELAPEVVVCFLGRTNVLSLLASAGTGMRVYACERSDPTQERLGAGWSALRRLTYPRAAGVVVQTERVAAWARAFCARVHVIPNFVVPPALVATPGAARSGHRLLAMGRLSHEKGFDLLLEAFGRVAERHPQWTLTVLGEGPARSALESLARTRCPVGRVSFPGRVPDPVPHLAAADAFALTSRYEGFPNALIEAMACGLAVVAFACPSGPAEIVTHERDGLLVPAGDVGALAAALDRLMADPGERARLGSSARTVTVRLAPERILSAWSALLAGDAGAGGRR